MDISHYKKKIVFAGLALSVISSLRSFFWPVDPNLERYSRSATVTHGKVLHLEHYYSMNVDCSANGQIVVRVTQPPTHGRAFVSDEMEHTFFVKGNQRYHCNAEKRPVVAVRYEPEIGYVGSDKLVVDVLFPDGVNRVSTFSITVK